MNEYQNYIINETEIKNVLNGLKLLRKHRLLSKFAKCNNLSQGGLSDFMYERRDLSLSSLTVYNKIVSNLDDFMKEHNILQDEEVK